MISSYPSIYSLGHRAVADLLKVPVLVEEKIDGSQISFGRYWISDDQTELRVRSKGAEIHLAAPQSLFSTAVKTIQGLDLHIGWTYRAEVISRPKHNTLTYGRVPKGNLIIFDVQSGLEIYLSYPEKALEAERLGLECVPMLMQGHISGSEDIIGLLDRESCLGKAKIEGVVIKQVSPALFGLDKKALIGKYVSEAFKEQHRVSWSSENPTGADIVELIGASLATEARWRKSIQHLQEAGQLTDSPKDIGPLVKETQEDVLRETADDIKEQLYQWALRKIQRRVVKGLPEFYKKYLLEKQFETSEVDLHEEINDALGG